MKQLSMFTTEDLPLFSGTAQRAQEQAFRPAEIQGQQGTWVKCRTCKDTGVVDGRPCWCKAGQRNLVTIDRVED